MHSPFSLELGLSSQGGDNFGVSFIFQDQVESIRRAHGNGPYSMGAIEQPQSIEFAPLRLFNRPIDCKQTEAGDHYRTGADDQTGILFGLFLQFINLWLNHHHGMAPRSDRYRHRRRYRFRPDELEPQERIDYGAVRKSSPGDVPPATALASKLARAASRVAALMNRTGRCAEGVQRALEAIGLPEFRGSGHAWNMLGPLMGSGKFEVVPVSQVTAGDIMLRRRPGDYGHIAIITGKDSHGNLMEASDHHASVRLDNPRYYRTIFLRLKQKDLPSRMVTTR